jgi:hypothetical protein
MFSEDTKQKLNFYSQVLGECFKVFMACLLAIFVPQNCEGHVCSLEENLSDLTHFNAFVLAWNFLTLALFMFVYYNDTCNETWLINSFDQKRDKPDNNLDTELNIYPKLREDLVYRTTKVYRSYLVSTIVFAINTVVSGVLVFYFYYYDFKTVTVLLTNVSLQITKMINGLTVSKRGLDEKLAISLYAKEPVLYNVIDKDYIKAHPLPKETTENPPTSI